MEMDYSCKKCRQPLGLEWCRTCHVKQDFDKWTSGNELIDKFIQNAQISATDPWKAIEWIPYERFKKVREIAKGGFSTIYLAKWIDGPLGGWDFDKERWRRWGKRYVILKKYDKIANINEEILNKVFFF